MMKVSLDKNLPNQDPNELIPSRYINTNLTRLTNGSVRIYVLKVCQRSLEKSWNFQPEVFEHPDILPLNYVVQSFPVCNVNK